ncbi:MAG: type II secretion system protein [Candidatus Omnitrophica bacterium]|nr:type II secretion system protein [Candidatus Omnitrophota bacterium]MDD5774780.1 type II secretion system protein [Candidatus Omnitrophota bacterium]HNQ50633.1 type II secretion system protein [Candidatus Omnitrophota bacterium]HQO37661.1 type II secretion system protein [Candidatus Omnitrophota bacterium]HQQ06919.1 type II secretion system protein [Candidatus Omnitrophota bacterium]
MKKSKDRIGLTLLEIIVAMLILSLVMYGFVSIFTVSKRFVYHSSSRVVSMEVAKFFFEDANLSVSADVYPDKNCLYNETMCQDANYTVNNILYNVSYVTGAVKNASDENTTLRKVVINVTWTEPS